MKKDSQSARRTFYLPAELDEWLEGEARKDRRSVSNFLTAMLEEKRGPNE
jgi:hypothetical protein